MKTTPKHVLALLFFPERFLDDHLKRNDELSGKKTRPFPLDARLQHGQFIREKRRNLAISAITVVCVIVGGWLAAVAINHLTTPSIDVVRGIRAFSMALVAWAVFGRLGDFESMGGETLLETASKAIYRLCYMTGIFIASLSLFLNFEPSGEASQELPETVVVPAANVLYHLDAIG